MSYWVATPGFALLAMTIARFFSQAAEAGQTVPEK
jgi:hypothetical protein